MSILCGSAEAAASEKLLAGEPARVFRGQENGNGGDVAWLADAAERSLRDEGLLQVRAYKRQNLSLTKGKRRVRAAMSKTMRHQCVRGKER